MSVSTHEEITVGQIAVRFLVEGKESGGSVAVFEFDVPGRLEGPRRPQPRRLRGDDLRTGGSPDLDDRRYADRRRPRRGALHPARHGPPLRQHARCRRHGARDRHSRHPRPRLLRRPGRDRRRRGRRPTGPRRDRRGHAPPRPHAGTLTERQGDGRARRAMNAGVDTSGVIVPSTDGEAILRARGARDQHPRRVRGSHDHPCAMRRRRTGGRPARPPRAHRCLLRPRGRADLRDRARGRGDRGLFRRIRRRAAAGSPLVPQRRRRLRALADHPRARRRLRSVHARLARPRRGRVGHLRRARLGRPAGKRGGRQPRGKWRAPRLRELAVPAEVRAARPVRRRMGARQIASRAPVSRSSAARSTRSS